MGRGYLARRNSQHVVTLLLKPPEPNLITLRPVPHVVSDALDLDHELGRRAIEVDHERSAWMLTAELELGLFQQAPQQDFGKRHLAP